MGDSTQITWTHEIENTSDDSEYDREARGTLKIGGENGTLVVKKTFRAMLEEGNGLQEPGEIRETSTYYRPNESEPFEQPPGHSWDVPVGELKNEEQFVENCHAALLADPEVEYEQRADDLEVA